MKIIDNKKDYYDWVSGVYGIDNSVVFDRRGSNVLKGNFHFSAIDRNTPQHKQLFYFHQSIEASQRAIQRISSKYPILKDITCHGNIFIARVYLGCKCYIFLLDRYNENETLLGDDWLLEIRERPKSNKPTLIEFGPCYGYSRWTYIDVDRELLYKVENPIFADTWITKHITPEQAWKDIYECLSSMKDKDIVDKRTDKEKIVSAGFDTKTSFRNM